jgi:hypothetical protein
MKIDIERRIKVLPEEVKRWNDAADAADLTKTVGKRGIYQSQIQALKLMMDELETRQTQLLKNLDPASTAEGYADAYFSLSDEIVGAHEIWRIFRYIIGLHKDDNLGPLVDAAGLIARDCYLTCMNKARDWNLVPEDEFRAPPLVYLEAEMSPSTASRGFAAESLGFPLRRYRNMRLPIPLILLPSDNASSMWMLATLHHEVGHNLDQDLKIKSSLSGSFITRLIKESIPDDRQKMWFFWMSEIIADVFGIMLGGAGFAHALSWWLLVLAPDPRFSELNTKDEHPGYYVRVYMIVLMLRVFNLPELNTAADLIKQKWDAMQKPNWVADYVKDCAAVVDFFFNQQVSSLGEQRTLRDLAPDMADDVRRVTELESYLRTNFLSPDVTLPTSAKWRHVPVAAQLAFINHPNLDLAALNDIQDRAMGYLARIVRPNRMSGATGTENFYRDLMRDLNFS